MSEMSITPQAQSLALKDSNEEFETRKHDLQSDHESKLRQIQKAYLKREADVRESGDAAINHIRKDSQARVQSEGAIIQENADQVLSRVDNESKQKIKTSQDEGIRTSEGLKKQYSKDIYTTQRRGEAELQGTKDKYAIELHNDENFYKEELNNQKKQFAEDQAKLQTQYEQKRKDSTELQRKNLETLTKKYNEQFVQNEGQNKESFNLQKQNFLKEIYRQQQELANKATSFESKIDDPFYQARDLKAHLTEHEGAYVLTAKIPQPEKTNYSVHVRDDKIVLESYRSNDAKIVNGSEKSETNSYQTNRQEFKLAYPVLQNKVVKQMDENGNLTVTIPKKDLDAKV